QEVPGGVRARLGHAGGVGRAESPSRTDARRIGERTGAGPLLLGGWVVAQGRKLPGPIGLVAANHDALLPASATTGTSCEGGLARERRAGPRSLRRYCPGQVPRVFLRLARRQCANHP